MTEKELGKAGEAREARKGWTVSDAGILDFADFTLPDGPHPEPKFVLAYRATVAAASDAAGREQAEPEAKTEAKILDRAATVGRLIELEVLVACQAGTIAKLTANISALGGELGRHWASPEDDGPGLARWRRAHLYARATRRLVAPVTAIGGGHTSERLSEFGSGPAPWHDGCASIGVGSVSHRGETLSRGAGRELDLAG